MPSDDNERERLEREWQELIAGYGERAELAPDDLLGPSASASAADAAHAGDEPRSAPLAQPEQPATWRGSTGPTFDEIEDGFVPPDPALPLPSHDRLVAWIGVLGMPLLALVLAITQLRPASVIVAAMIVWCLAGFGYLVWQLPHRRPRYDGDDGAQI